MKLSRKIQKLFSSEALESLREHAHRSFHPVALEPMLKRVDREKWRDLERRHPVSGPKVNKFAGLERGVRDGIERAQDLWLDQSPPQRILDLGCGPGFFIFAGNCLGHEAMGMDIDEQELFRETTALLGVRRVIHRIEAREPLPDLGGRFDVITAHRVCFYKKVRNEAGQWVEWDANDWQFLIDDLRTRMLNPAGRLLLDFNPRQGEGRYTTPEVTEVLLKNGARLSRSKALLAAQPGAVPRFKP